MASLTTGLVVAKLLQGSQTQSNVTFLELQLKPNHIPMLLTARWPTYLRKYTELDEKDAALQKPQIVLRRNVFATRDQDLRVCNNIIR